MKNDKTTPFRAGRRQDEERQNPRKVSVAIQRLLDEVRNEQTTPLGLFDRAHNRHNRS